MLPPFETFTIAPISCSPPCVVSDAATLVLELEEPGGTHGL